MQRPQSFIATMEERIGEATYGIFPSETLVRVQLVLYAWKKIFFLGISRMAYAWLINQKKALSLPKMQRWYTNLDVSSDEPDLHAFHTSS